MVALCRYNTWGCFQNFPIQRGFVGRYITSWLPQSLHIFSSLMNWLRLGLWNTTTQSTQGKSLGAFCWGGAGVFFFQVFSIFQKITAAVLFTKKRSCGSKVLDPPKMDLVSLYDLYPRIGTPEMLCFVAKYVVTLLNFGCYSKGFKPPTSYLFLSYFRCPFKNL